MCERLCEQLCWLVGSIQVALAIVGVAREAMADSRFTGPSDSWEQPDVGAIYRKWGII